MTIERRVKTEEVDAYVAIDGKVFFSELECAHWEQELLDLEKIELLDEARQSLFPTSLEQMQGHRPINAANENYTYYWFQIKTSEQLDALSILLGRNIQKTRDTYALPNVLHVATNVSRWMEEGYLLTQKEQHEAQLGSMNLSLTHVKETLLLLGYEMKVKKVASVDAA